MTWRVTKPSRLLGKNPRSQSTSARTESQPSVFASTLVDGNFVSLGGISSIFSEDDVLFTEQQPPLPSAKAGPLPWLRSPGRRHASVLLKNRFSDCSIGQSLREHFSMCERAQRPSKRMWRERQWCLSAGVMHLLLENESFNRDASALKTREALQPRRVATTDAGAVLNTSTHTHTACSTAVGTHVMSFA